MALTGLTGLAPLGARAGRSLLTPEEEESLIGSLAGAGASALGVIGNFLDTPGSFIRTTLAGENPFPAIFDTSRRVSGRDLLQRAGILGENYEGFDMGDVLGFATEVATDPLTLVGGGVTKAGSIAKSLGKFPKRSTFDVGTGALKLGKRTARRGSLGSVLEGAGDDVLKHAELLAEQRGSRLADLMDEPMQRSIGLGLPFRENFLTFDLPGAAGRAAGMDWLGGKARMSWHGRELARMFDRTVRNASGGKAQEVAKNFTEQFEPAAQEVEARHLARNDALLAAGVEDPDIRRNLVEGFHPDSWGETLSPADAVRRNLPPLAGEDLVAYEARTKPVVDALEKFRSEGDKLLDRRIELGLTNPYRVHEKNYSARQLTRPEPGTTELPSTNFELGRTDIGDIPTTAVNKAMEDEEFVGLAKNIEINPLSAESLTKRTPDEIKQYLDNAGYDDLEDLVDWQAKGMLSAKPNLSGRTVIPPKPGVDADALNAARAHVLERYLNVPREQFEQTSQWLGDAKSLPKLREEFEEVRAAAEAGDYAKSLPEQEVAIELQLANAMKARDEYVARKQLLDARDINSRADKLADDEVRELAALRNEADRVPLWRSRLKRVQERIAAGERQIFPAEQMDELQDQIGIAENAKASLAAMQLKVDMADALIRHANKYGVGRTFNNDVLVDSIAKRLHDTRRIAWGENVQDAIARNTTTQAKEGVEYETITDAMRRAGAAGLDATSMAQALKRTVNIGKEAGTIDATLADNIAGPHAVATSGIISDPELAQAMRTRELLATREAMIAAGANQSEIAAKMAEIGRMPLPNVSAAGNVMRVKQAYADVALDAAKQSRDIGLLDGDAYKAVTAEIDKWLKSDKFHPGETAQQMLGPEAMQVVSAARAANPIPNDGLLAIKNLLVPKEFVDQLVAARSLWEAPSKEKTIGTIADAIRRVTKAHFTLPFPGFHGRNIQGSAALFATLRAFDPNIKGPKGIVKPLFDMWDVLRGRGIRDAENFPQVRALGLKGQEAQQWVLSQISAKGGLRGAGDTLTEGIEPTFVGDIRRSVAGGESAEQLARNVPGNAPIDAEYFKAPFRKREGVNRVNALDPEQFALTAAGARVSNFTENLFRGAAMIGLMRQGKTVDEAAALMKAAFVDYSNLTKWERTYARRVIPFWSWLRHASVFAARNLAEQPAGFNAQLARLARVAEQDAGFLPPQLGGSLAIPIGQEEDGTQRYLSQMDFPVETLNRVINPMSAQDTLRGLLSQTDPMIKGVIEYATGKNLFRGRNIEDLESPSGRLAANLTGADEPLWKSPLLDTALANSPLARYLSTAAQAGDSRKGWGTFGLNTLTGLRISDQDMSKARRITASQAAKELLEDAGAKTIEVLSFSKEEMASLDPASRAEVQKLQAILKSLAKQSKGGKDR